MGRPRVRQANENRPRQSRSRMVVAGIVVVLLFALVGVVSAGAYVANHVGSGSSPTAQPTPSGNGPSVALLELQRAHAQATAIVRQARNAGQSIVQNAASKARKQASAIVAAAKRRSRSAPQITSPTAPAPVIAPTPVPAAGNGLSTGTGSSASGFSGSGTTVVTTPLPGVPDLSGLPASWKVVGYNASFGAGPGSAGSITVVNRSSATFSGTARVVYAHGGAATAYFAGLGPGQVRVLALNGPRYAGGGYSIIVNPR